VKFIIKWGLLLIPTLVLAIPALAQTRDTRLADYQAPGSVIIFSKFINRLAITTFGDNAVLPRSEIEIGIVCPPGVEPTTTVCFEHQTITLKFHWVCPGSDDFTTQYICPETDFNVVLSVNGKLAFSADGTPIGTPPNSNTPRVPAAPCANGYLIGWVVDNADRPIKWDGLIGDAVLRGPNIDVGGGQLRSTAVASYSGITIQAHPALANGALITLGSGGELLFDGAAGHYQAVTGKNYGDVKFDNPTARTSGVTPLNALNETWLILLTLDVRSGRPNYPTFVDLDFFNESLATVSTTNPLWEAITSSGLHFICWGQFKLSDIDSNLTQDFQGSRKGVVITSNAEKEAFGGVADEAGPVTLLGLVQVFEGTVANRYMERSYIVSMYNNRMPQPIRFRP